MLPPSTLVFEDTARIDSRCAKAAGALLAHDPAPPRFSLEDLALQKSEGSGCSGLRVNVCTLPMCDNFITTECRLDAYHFQFRARVDKGPPKLRIPSLGLSTGHSGHERWWLIPPGLQVEGEWTNAAGTVTVFFFTSDFLRGLADQLGLSVSFLGRPRPVPFSSDDRFENLCRLLITETEDCCLQGALYFEALARALALSLLHRVCYPKSETPKRTPSVPPGVRAIIERLQKEFWERLSVGELARAADLSVSHFTRSFEKATGLTPHRYLLHARLSRARQLIAQQAPALSLAEIAALCGFSDQGHLGRHFRCVFGMTPAAFRRAQGSPGDPQRKSAGCAGPGARPSHRVTPVSKMF
jgi:AraC-like DNA-binding protein/rRNA maturation protein Nop10